MQLDNIYERIKNRSRPFLVAEIGVNYYDIASVRGIKPIDAAFLMIDEAKKSGADAVKFQSYKAEKLVVKDSPAYWDLNEESVTSQYELFTKFDKFGENEFEKLAAYCEKKNIIFMSTPFDFEAVDYLDRLMPIFKISSSDITNWPFIKHIAKKGKPIFLSTGASNVDEIDGAINVIQSRGNDFICILHCILNYPTEDKNAHLNMIKDLKNRYPNYLIGYSDHTVPDSKMIILTTAYFFGAKVIEKHFTLDKSLSGNDHYHAMDPEDIRTFVHNIKLINRISGKLHKKNLPSENQARLYARRSIVAKNEIAAGEEVRMENLIFKRPGTGISPVDLSIVLGKKAKRKILKDEILKWEHFKSS